jgi:hypothetical protein
MAGHNVDATFTGSVLDVHLFLEGQETTLREDPASGSWMGHQDGFEIPGDLKLRLRCKGLNGTKWSLTLRVDDKGPYEKSGVIDHGVSEWLDSIPIPLKAKA